MDTYAISSTDAESFETFATATEAEAYAEALEAAYDVDVSRWRAVIEEDYLTRAERPGWRRVGGFV